MNGNGVNIYTNNNEWLRIVACELTVLGTAAHFHGQECLQQERTHLPESPDISSDEVFPAAADKFLFMFQV